VSWLLQVVVLCEVQPFGLAVALPASQMQPPTPPPASRHANSDAELAQALVATQPFEPAPPPPSHMQDAAWQFASVVAAVVQALASAPVQEPFHEQ
jgi:hypothetical protein